MKHQFFCRIKGKGPKQASQKLITDFATTTQGIETMQPETPLEVIPELECSESLEFASDEDAFDLSSDGHVFD